MRKSITRVAILPIIFFCYVSTMSMEAQTAQDYDYYKKRNYEDLSSFSVFSCESTDPKEGIRTTAIWETDLLNSDGYDNHNYAMFKYRDVLYVYGFYYNYNNDKHLYFRRFNALTGEEIEGDDGGYISKVTIPDNNGNIGWPYESFVNMDRLVDGSWIRFFMDENGEIGLLSFIRNKNITGNQNRLGIYVRHLDVEKTFETSELVFKGVPRSYSYDNIFGNRENFVSEVFNAKGSLIDGNIAFDFIVLKLKDSGSADNKQWYHFDESNSNNLSSTDLIFANETQLNKYDPYTVCGLYDGSYVINSPHNGTSLIAPSKDSAGYEFVSAWNDMDEETDSPLRVKNYCFVPVNIGGEEYYITTRSFPAINVDEGSIDGENTLTTFSLRRWRNKQDFSALTEVISLPSIGKEFNYICNSPTSAKNKILATISQKCVVEYEYKTTSAEDESVLGSLRSKDNSNEAWAKTICYLYSPSAGMGRYEFEPVYDGWLTGINAVDNESEVEIHRSGDRLWTNGTPASLKVYNVSGAVVYSSEYIAEANLGFLAPGCYIVSWGTGLRKIILN